MSNRMVDLQTEWKPRSFHWGVAYVPFTGSGMCFCLGSITAMQKAAGLCNCEWARKYGEPVVERFVGLIEDLEVSKCSAGEEETTTNRR